MNKNLESGYLSRKHITAQLLQMHAVPQQLRANAFLDREGNVHCI